MLDHLRTHWRGSGSQRYTTVTSAHWATDSQKACRDPFVTLRNIQRQLTPSKCAPVTTQTIRSSLLTVGLRTRQTAIGALLSARPTTWPTNDISHCSHNESRFFLGTNDSGGQVWRFSGRRHLTTHIMKHHTVLMLRQIVWRHIIFGQRTAFVHIAGSLTTKRYFNQVCWTVICPLV